MGHPIPYPHGALARNLQEWGNGDQTARDVVITAWHARANAYLFLENIGALE